MVNSKFPILQLKRQQLIDPNDDRAIELATYDVRLPCRSFMINYKVALLGRVSLTAEFLLRLVKTSPGIAEDDAATFFGFNRREVAFVFRETEEPGYIERRDGRLWLTSQGQTLFRDGSSEPEIFKVEQRRQDFGFDLISLAPQPRRPLSHLELNLPELAISDEERAGSAAKHLPEAFRRFYRELAERKDRIGTEKKDLYSIDHVEPKERFSSKVRLTVRAQASFPTAGEGDLSLWRPDHKQEDRPEIITAITSFVDMLKTSQRSDDERAYQILLDLAPEFLKDFARRDGLAVKRYYREALKRTADVRADRRTVPVIGSTFLTDNRKRLFDALEYGLRAERIEPRFMFWFAPQVPHWGATTRLEDTVRAIQTTISAQTTDVDNESVKSLCLVYGRRPRFLEKAFDHIFEANVVNCPASLEMVLVPRVAVAAIVHAPIGAMSGHAVPLGIVSFDESVLARAHKYVLDNIGFYITQGDMLDQIEAELSKDMLASVTPVNS